MRFAGADHGSYILNPVLKNIDASDLSFERSLTLVHAADPSAEILIAYEMNGEPLSPDHGSPFRLIVPHWYGVASVKWLKHIEVLTEPFIGEFETGHYMYQWHDRPAERVTVMRPRARITDPSPGAVVRLGDTCVVRGKAWSGTGPVTNVDVSLTGEGDWLPAHLETPRGPYQWQNWSFEWQPTNAAGRPCAHEPPTRQETCSPKFPSGTGSATATTRSRSSTSTFDSTRCKSTPDHPSTPYVRALLSGVRDRCAQLLILGVHRARVASPPAAATLPGHVDLRTARYRDEVRFFAVSRPRGSTGSRVLARVVDRFCNPCGHSGRRARRRMCVSFIWIR